jgi:uncharacterized protein YmfQ (DUF2313 family)
MRLDLARDPTRTADQERQPVCGFSPADYAQAIADLLPWGWAWSRDPNSVLMRTIEGLAVEYARVHQRDCDLLAESYPGTALETLTDWERICGLPDPCTGPLDTIQERRLAILAKLAARGGQSRQYFIDIAAAIGFTITIDEFNAFRVGQNRTSQPLYGEEWMFYWRVTSWEQNQKIIAFRVGQSATRERLRSWGNDMLECLIRGYMPAHTVVQFAYQQLISVWDAGQSVWDGGASNWDLEI